MPTYDYQCEKCHKTFEVFQSMKDPVLLTCPKDLCQRKTWGKGKIKRQVGAGAGLIFKGSGFYITDYRSEGYKEASKTAAKSESGGGGESKSGETKGGESKGGDAKGGDSKGSEKPKTEAKPAPVEKPKPAPKSKKD